MSALLAQPEFSHTDAVLPLVQVLEDDTVLLHILDDLTSTDEDLSVQYREGKQDRGPLGGLPLWPSRYGRGEAEGVVAVIGPTRMDYSKVIQAVRAASAALGRIVVNCAALATPLTKVFEKGKRWPRTCMRFSACRRTRPNPRSRKRFVAAHASCTPT